MNDGSRKAEERAVLRALTSTYCPELIREAREKQDAVLSRRFVGQRSRIADIGCGTGYHGVLFGPTCQLYHGFEIAPDIAEIARDNLRDHGIDHARIFEGDVAQAEIAGSDYDLVVCLYFTPGNIRDPSDDLDLYSDEYLDRNPRFVDVISRFHDAMGRGGAMLLTIYKDVPEAEAAQIDFYVETGQRILTAPGSRFVATEAGFWSVRWTVESMLSNLRAGGIDESTVRFHDLNSIAWLVEITKPN